MTRKILIGAAAIILFIFGMSTAFAHHHVNLRAEGSAIYQRSPDCKYPPCD